MPASIGVNLRVTGHCRQGVAYQQTEDEKDLEYAFFGIYDGHGGAEAAAFAKEHLMETIIKHKSFWSDCDEDVLRAIKDGYIATHYAMWRERGWLSGYTTYSNSREYEQYYCNLQCYSSIFKNELSKKIHVGTYKELPTVGVSVSVTVVIMIPKAKILFLVL
nr:unnamed protein product [Callosobruchus analis]